MVIAEFEAELRADRIRQGPKTTWSGKGLRSAGVATVSATVAIDKGLNVTRMETAKGWPT
jgi:hypothetical protein